MDNSDFFSLDKLVEFGMSASIANQMASSMNETLKQMRTPGVDSPAQIAGETIYFAELDGKPAGPFSITEMSRLISEKRVVRETYVWKPGMPEWVHVENVSEILKLVALTPPPLP